MEDNPEQLFCSPESYSNYQVFSLYLWAQQIKYVIEIGRMDCSYFAVSSADHTLQEK